MRLYQELKFLYRAYRYRVLKDTTEINFLLRNIQKGDTVLDIGAHKGAYLFWLQKQTGNSGKVFAFEAQPVLFEYLKQVRSAFHFKNVTLENIAVSNQQGEMQLFIPEIGKTSSPGATLNASNTFSQSRNIIVQVTSLDSYFANYAGNISFIKMDVEGHEAEVFEGAENILLQHKPVLLFECERRHCGEEKMKKVFSNLQAKVYAGYFISRKKILPLSEFDFEKHQKTGEGKFWEAEDYCNNFIFTHSER